MYDQLLFPNREMLGFSRYASASPCAPLLLSSPLHIGTFRRRTALPPSPMPHPRPPLFAVNNACPRGPLSCCLLQILELEPQWEVDRGWSDSQGSTRWGRRSGTTIVKAPGVWRKYIKAEEEIHFLRKQESLLLQELQQCTSLS